MPPRRDHRHGAGACLVEHEAQRFLLIGVRRLSGQGEHGRVLGELADRVVGQGAEESYAAGEPERRGQSVQPGRVFAGAYLDERDIGVAGRDAGEASQQRIDPFLLAVPGGIEHVALGAGTAHRREPVDIDPDVVPDDPIGGVSEGQQPAADVIGYRDERGATRA
jgi:hypothetical protein